MKYINLIWLLLALSACCENQYTPKAGELSMPPLYDEVPHGSKS